MVASIAWALAGMVSGMLLTKFFRSRRRLTVAFHEERIDAQVRDSLRWDIHVWPASSGGAAPRLYIGWIESMSDSDGPSRDVLLTYPISIAGAVDMAHMLEQAAESAPNPLANKGS